MNSSICKNGIELCINNPNPMQNINKFINLLEQLDLNRVGSLVLFGDFIGLHSEEKYRANYKMIETLSIKYPQLKIIYTWGIDSLQYKNDGEFIGKKMGRKTITSKYYNGALLNLKKLIINTSEFNSETTYHKHYINLIIHPAMGIAEFEKKSLLCENFESLKGVKVKARKFVLSPFRGTKIATNFGKYALEQNNKVLTEERRKDDFEELWVNNWSYFFKNSHLIDADILINSTIWKTQVINFLKNSIKKSGDSNMYFIPYIINNLIRIIASWVIEDKKGEKNSSYKTIINNLINYLNFMKDRDIFLNKKIPKSLPNDLIVIWEKTLNTLINNLKLIEGEIGKKSSEKLQKIIIPKIKKEDDDLYDKLSGIKKPKYRISKII